MPQLIRTFHNVYLCPFCDQPMHVDPFPRDSPIRVISCENPACPDYGFAWHVDITTAIGVSDRPASEPTPEEVKA